MAAELLIVNPHKRSKSKRKRNPRRRAHHRKNPFFGRARRRRGRRSRLARLFRRRRSNPIGLSKHEISAALMGGGIAALGAIGLDYAWANLPIPEDLKSGPLQIAAKAAGAIALGVVAAKVSSKRTGNLFTLGALTVVAYQLGRHFIATNLPTVHLGYAEPGFGMYDAGNPASFPVGGVAGCGGPRALSRPAQGMGDYMAGHDEGMGDADGLGDDGLGVYEGFGDVEGVYEGGENSLDALESFNPLDY